MGISRRHLQLGLAALWLLDGALQCQRFMFTRAFALTVLAPAGRGQPAIISDPVHWSSNIVAANPVVANIVFATVQLGLCAGLLFRRSVRMTLMASIVWALSIWWLGEGFGGISSGATVFMGAPGAALLYALVAALAWPGTSDRGQPPPRWAIPAWASLWLGLAGLQIVAGNDSGSAFANMLSNARSGTPSWIASLDGALAHLSFTTTIVGVCIALQVLVAMWALVPGTARRLSILVGAGVATTGWVLVQGFGELASGHATDPNTGPLILLLALAVWGSDRAPRKAATPSLARRGWLDLLPVAAEMSSS